MLSAFRRWLISKHGKRGRSPSSPTYYFDMSFNMGGQTVNLGGRDMFVFVKESDKWLAVADQLSLYPAT